MINIQNYSDENFIFLIEKVEIELKNSFEVWDDFKDLYGKNDIRTATINSYISFLLTYCLGLKYLCTNFKKDVSDILKRSNVCNSNIEKQKLQYFNSLNRHLLIDSWGALELFDNVILENIKTCLTQENDKDFIKSIKTKGIPKTFISKKNIKIIEKILCNDEDILKFLKYFGYIRNSSHANFLHHGDDDFYEFNNDTTFIFKKGKLLEVKSDSLEIYFLLIKELFKIITQIIESKKIKDIKFMQDPSYDTPKITQ